MRHRPCCLGRRRPPGHGPDGVTGLHVPPRDPAALADAVRRLLADPELRAALGTAGAARARARYAWDIIAAKTCAVYEGLVSRRARSEADTLEAQTLEAQTLEAQTGARR